MKLFVVVALVGLGLTFSTPSHAGVRKHALAKAAHAVAKSVVAAPKATAVGLKDTIGGILFVAEAGVDVAHAGTTALSAAASKELKVNPFKYADKVVSYADAGLEKAYSFFFNAQI